MLKNWLGREMDFSRQENLFPLRLDFVYLCGEKIEWYGNGNSEDRTAGVADVGRE